MNLDQTRTELWEAGIKYAKACIGNRMTQGEAISKWLDSAGYVDKDTLAIVKCSIAFGYIGTKEITVTFGSGPDKVVMTDKARSIDEYIGRLKALGWQVDEITKVEVK